MGKECSTESWCSRSWFANVIFPPQSGGGSCVLEMAKRGMELVWAASGSGGQGGEQGGQGGIKWDYLSPAAPGSPV